MAELSITLFREKPIEVAAPTADAPIHFLPDLHINPGSKKDLAFMRQVISFFTDNSRLVAAGDSVNLEVPKVLWSPFFKILADLSGKQLGNLLFLDGNHDPLADLEQGLQSVGAGIQAYTSAFTNLVDGRQLIMTHGQTLNVFGDAPLWRLATNGFDRIYHDLAYSLGGLENTFVKPLAFAHRHQVATYDKLSPENSALLVGHTHELQTNQLGNNRILLNPGRTNHINPFNGSRKFQTVRADESGLQIQAWEYNAPAQTILPI